MCDSEAIRIVQEEIEGLSGARHLRSQDPTPPQAVDASLHPGQIADKSGKAAQTTSKGAKRRKLRSRKGRGGRIKGKLQKNSRKKPATKGAKGQAKPSGKHPIMQDQCEGSTVCEAQYMSHKAIMTCIHNSSDMHSVHNSSGMHS